MVQQTIQKLLAGQGKVLVVGLGITGIETALFLERCEIPCVCIEKTPREEYLEGSKFRDRIQELENRGIILEFGIEGESVERVLGGVTLAVLSPGVSLESAIVGTLRRHQVQIISEIELGMVLAAAPAIAVTGSNGKTTTVTLIQHLLQSAGVNSLLCGNVGTPILSALSPDDVKSGGAERFQYLVVEASSYQLETCETIRPKVAVFLNLSDNHLERHGSMQRYFEAKARICANQTSAELAVLNADDQWAQKLKARVAATQAWFGVAGDAVSATHRAKISYDAAAHKDEITVHLHGRTHTFELSGTKLLGLHNRYDAAAALLAAWAVGVSPELLQHALLTFEPLEHRLEPVGESAGVLYINDSKSTTVAASVAALRAITEAHPHRPVVLMLGGMAKAGSWEPL
ncbi:MAG: UDP-N-acetylmuramoyl-L-alanine--D-glutamate ligase, partial [Proteobacteria bacterium]|nr:UDP-N-acetylmuramoyl-L-alanine--D-glutamate ligase [Pseudomonadota bacterium]